MKTHYTLTALKDFGCIGDRCPASCCGVGWDIEVDEATHQQWRSWPEPARTDALSKIKTVERDGHRRTVLITSDGRRCAHLSEGLCQLQRDHGHEAIPLTCREYPRLRGDSAAATLASASLSCPEIVRLALRREGPLFEEQKPLGDPWLLTDEERINHALTMFVDRVLAEARFPLSIRILYIGRVLSELASLSASGELDEIHLQRLLGRTRNGIYELNLAVKSHRVRPDPATAGGFWLKAHDLSNGFLTEHLRAQRHALAQTLLAAFADTDASPARIYEHILRYRKGSEAKLQPLQGALEKYLRVGLLNKGFPWNPAAGNHAATFVYSVICFALLKLVLWVELEEKGTLAQEDLEKAVYRVERRIGHTMRVYHRLNHDAAFRRLDTYYHCFADL